MPVNRVEEVESVPCAGGRRFGVNGAAGPATLRRLRVHHAVDPHAPANAAIVDLDLAERDADGRVRFDHDVVIVQLDDVTARNGWAMVDVPNRGGPTISAFLQADDTAFYPQPEQPPIGDGHLLAAGWTLVFAGWQFDITQPSLLGLRAPVARAGGAELSGPVRYTFRAGSGSSRLPLVLPGHRLWPPEPDSAVLYQDDVAQPPDSWRFDVDRASLERPGGFEAGAWYRCEYSTTGALVGGCGLLALRDVVPWLRATEGVSRTILFGISQSGRVIRQFLHDGLNVDEAGVAAYDAVMPVIAGGRRGQFNRRFAVPGALPFGAEGTDVDPTYGTLLARAGAPLKVMAMNSASEYWRGDAAGLWPEDHPDVRVHHVAGTQHTAGYLPQLFELKALGWKGRHGFNTIDYRPVLRALLEQVVAWVEHGVPPTPSTAPDPAQLSTRDAVLARFAGAGVATPREASFVQPAGPVPAVDELGNELGGIRLPDVAAPVGVHTGWNVRHPDMGAEHDELFLVGSSWWLDELADLDTHRARTAAVVAGLVERRLLLEADVPAVLARAELAWHTAAAAIAARPPAG